jgi:hypothetical protein
MDQSQAKNIIGRVEKVSFPELGIGTVHARIDTGAQTSAIWVSHTKVVDGKLEVVFLGKAHPFYSGKTFYFDEFSHGMVASSNGQAEARYKVRTIINIGGKRIRARLTLADRSTQTYPILIGRNVLRGKFIVDVKAGEPLVKEEKERSIKLQSTLKKGRTQ